MGDWRAIARQSIMEGEVLGFWVAAAGKLLEILIEIYFDRRLPKELGWQMRTSKRAKLA